MASGPTGGGSGTSTYKLAPPSLPGNDRFDRNAEVVPHNWRAAYNAAKNLGEQPGSSGHQAPSALDRNTMALERLTRAIQGMRSGGGGQPGQGGGGPGMLQRLFFGMAGGRSMMSGIVSGNMSQILGGMYGLGRAGAGLFGAGGGAAAGGAGAGAAGGAGGAGGLAAAGAAGPAAIALLAVAGLVAFVAALKNAADTLIEKQKELAKFSPSMAGVYARRDISEMFRERRRGELLSGSTERLIDQEQRFKDSTFNIEVMYEDLKTQFLTGFYASLADIASSVNNILKRLNLDSKDKQTQEAVKSFGDAVFDIRNRAEAKQREAEANANADRKGIPRARKPGGI